MTTILITGSSRGIGLEFARQYAEAGARVIATCRQPDQAEELQLLAQEQGRHIVVEPLDVGEQESVLALARKYKGEPIDILINNAGVIGPRDPNKAKLHEQFFGSLNYEAWSDVMNINTFGPLRIAEAFIENVTQSNEKKIVMISSTIGSIVESSDIPVFLYSTSKAALNKATNLMAGVLKDRDVIAAAFCPGHVKTELGGDGAALEPEASVAGLRALIAKLSLKDSGTFTRYNGEPISW